MLLYRFKIIIYLVLNQRDFLKFLNMKKIILSFGVVCLAIFVGCKSDAEKAIDKAEEIAEEYINVLNTARTKEDVQKARKEYKERASFELRKIMNASSNKETEQKLMNSETDLEWEDIQRAKIIGEEIERAERNAVNRTY